MRALRWLSQLHEPFKIGDRAQTGRQRQRVVIPLDDRLAIARAVLALDTFPADLAPDAGAGAVGGYDDADVGRKGLAGAPQGPARSAGNGSHTRNQRQRS